MSKILKFGGFENIFESDKENKNISLVSQIMTAFYNVYSALIPLSSDYDKIVDDIQAIASEGAPTKKDPTGKSESMEKMIDSVISEIDDEYKEVSSDFKNASEIIIGSYLTLLGQFDEGDSEEVRKIVNAVSKSAVRFISNLKDSKKEVRETESSDKYTNMLFEARNMKQRNEILQSIVSAKASVQNNVELGGLKSLRGTFKGYLDELEEFTNKLNKENEEYWKGLKRKERLEELEKISNRVSEIPSEMGSRIMKYTRKMGADKDSFTELEQGVKAFEEAMGKLKSIEGNEIKTSKATPEEEKKAEKEMGLEKGEEDKDIPDVNKEYKNIDPEDIENSRKDGKNRESIREYQEKVNLLMDPDKDYKSIETDGLYGKNTKKAISEVQKMLNKLGAGLNTKGSLTSQTQKSMDSFLKNKDQILDLLKK